MILVTGEILFDLFENRRQLGGAPFNFAFHLKKMGFDVRFVSRVGNDDFGKEIVDFLAGHQFDTSDIQIDSVLSTGTVQVEVTENGHAFTITENAAWDRIEFDHRMRSLLAKSPDLLYFGSLVQRTEPGQALIHRILEHKPPETRVFCDINLRPASYTNKVIQTCLAAADILKLNQEELTASAGDTAGVGTAAQTAAARDLMAEHPISRTILTLGLDGSTWITSDTVRHCPAAPVHQIKDTVGAGDGYAAMSAAGLLKKLPVNVCMDLASEFAAHICTLEGALPKDEHIYRKFNQRMDQHGF
ncbi:MAG: carbohydrate kinase [Desulfotignum sp.]|nr:carbohydrate kinase [Desulfotignum sp.]MCF8089715.1 carbohydrate kinase [Desulfotignum sp.]MCF8138858.1 carbohydrate kinase [Desulfotignum sp.]